MAIDDPSMADEGSYIDMEFKSSSLIEFQFQMNSNLNKPSSADELFYKGKLLPLRLIHDHIDQEEKAARTPRASAAATPYMSCNASAAAAAKRSWSQKLKSIKEAAAALASKAYLKSLLHKVKEGSKRKGKVRGELQKQEHRIRSFSSSSIWQSPSKSWSSSSSSSFSSVNSAALKRSSSVNSDAETSIKGAIAHCKKSSQQKDVGFCLLNVAKIAPDCEERE